jgi:hypothetical protein
VLLSYAVVSKPSKLEVEKHGIGIYLPASSHVLGSGRAGLFAICQHTGPQPFPEFFDAPRTFVRIAVLARRHLVRPTVPSARSRMNVVGSQDKLFSNFSVSLRRTVQSRSAVPAPSATLHPEVFSLEFRRIQGECHFSQTDR